MTFRRLAFLAASTCLITACGARNYDIAVKSLETESWIEIRADLFSIVTNAGEPAGRRLAHRLARFIDTLEQFSELEFDLYEPVQVFVFKEPEQFRQYPVGWAAGLFVPGHDLAMLTADPSATIVLYHEFVHFLLRETVVTPAWFQEGLAELLATARVREDVARIGFIAPMRANGLMHSEPLSMQFILNLHGYPKKYEDVGRFYTDSWLLVHQLNTSGDWDLSNVMKSYLVDLSRGEDRVEAWERAVGMSLSDFEELREAHRESLQKGVIKVVELVVPEKSHEFQLVKLSPGAASGRLGTVALVLEEHGLASSLFERQLELDPTSAGAMRGLAAALQLEGDLDEAETLARAALGADSRSAPSLEQLGNVLAARSERLTDRGQQAESMTALEGARDVYREALERDPSASSAQLALGRTYLREGDPELGIALVAEIIQSLSWSAPAHLALGELWLRAGNKERARTELLFVANAAHAGNDAKRAKELLDELEGEGG